LSSKNLNPSWTTPQIATFIQQAENRPPLKRQQLVTKVRRILIRNTIDDRPRSGPPVTVSTTDVQQKVKVSMKLKQGASIRNVTQSFNRNGTKCSAHTVLDHPI
jgi:activator of HSP90 ATPase